MTTLVRVERQVRHSTIWIAREAWPAWLLALQDTQVGRPRGRPRGTGKIASWSQAIRAYHTLRHRIGRHPTEEELAAFIGWYSNGRGSKTHLSRILKGFDRSYVDLMLTSCARCRTRLVASQGVRNAAQGTS